MRAVIDFDIGDPRQQALGASPADPSNLRLEAVKTVS
jgi:hypothetical protein